MDIEQQSPKKVQEHKLIMDSPKPMTTSKNKRRTRNICLCLLFLILILSLLILILALTVFKVKRSVPTVNSVTLSDLDFSLDIVRMRVNLNITLDMNVSVKNPNRFGFTNKNATNVLMYRGEEVGQVPIPSGHIGPRQTKSMNLTLVLMADRLISNSALYSDVVEGGTLRFQTFTKISGKVRVIFDVHVVSYTTCDLEVSITNRKVSKQECHYKNKM